MYIYVPMPHLMPSCCSGDDAGRETGRAQGSLNSPGGHGKPLEGRRSAKAGVVLLVGGGRPRRFLADRHGQKGTRLDGVVQDQEEERDESSHNFHGLHGYRKLGGKPCYSGLVEEPGFFAVFDGRLLIAHAGQARGSLVLPGANVMVQAPERALALARARFPAPW